MKICTKCKLSQEDEEFFFRNKKKGTLHSYCKTCKREIDKKSYSDPNSVRAKKLRINALAQINRAKNFVRDLKQKSCCSKCGDKRYYVLEFHHLGNKKFNISEMVKRGSSVDNIKKEIDKCVLVCANCHKEIHYLENSKMDL